MPDPQRTSGSLAPYVEGVRGADTANRDALVRELAEELDLARLPTQEEIKASLVERFLSPSNTFPASWLSDYATHWEKDPLLGLLEGRDGRGLEDVIYAAPGETTTSLEFVTAGLEGRIVGSREVSRPGASLTSKTSTSLARAPANYSNEFVRGKSNYLPFVPGGLDEAVTASDSPAAPTVEDDEAHEMVEKLEKGFEVTRGGIRTIPPGFTRGLDFSDTAPGPDDDAAEAEMETVKATPLYRPLAGTERSNGLDHDKGSSPIVDVDKEVEELLPVSRLGLAQAPRSVRRKGPVIAKKDWAHVVDVNRELSNFHELVPDMAKEYPFELDTFQKEAVYHLEMGDSVFVAAHTSAGKTVVAEYAIALAAKHMTRCIYTSPIKALSNQKFRDFKQTFDPETVGILTGDVQINPEGSCLIMTTEILRSMLYKGADLIRDVEFVVFDEVHYVNDAERGVVWEEVIIMLPEHVTIILLSATVPNTKEFADWVGRTKKRDIYVISTPKRPVPLEHFLYAGRELFKIVDAKGEFLGNGWKDANEALRRKQDKEREAAGLGPLVKVGASAARGAQRGQRGATPGRGGRGAAPPARGRGGGGGGGTFSRGPQRDQNLWIHLVGVLRKKELLPVVVFTFSKRRCEENAASMPNTDLCTAAEKSEVHVTIERSLTRLRGSDKKLPQIAQMRDLLSRGIGVHHGGLLPIVKEMVEILFARGLVKVLFATETFAMGVNMPARTVVFSGIRKHDGRSFRDLLAGEYTQMSGRAGRRGLDATGVVIIVCDGEVPDTPTLHKMLLGQPTKLQSQFRLTYNMILNLLRVEALRVEEMIKRSFSENAQQRLLPEHQKQVAEGEKELNALQKLEDSPRNTVLRQYYDIASRLVELNSRILTSILAHPAASRLISSGRMIILSDGHFRNNFAVVLKPAPSVLAAERAAEQHRNFFVLAFVSPAVRAGAQDIAVEAVAPRWPPRPSFDQSIELTYELAIVSTSSIVMVTRSTLKVDVDAIADRHRKSAMQAALSTFTTNFLPSLGPTHTLEEADFSKVRSLDFQETLQSREDLVEQLQRLDITEDEEFAELYQIVHAENVLRAKVVHLRQAISEQNLELLPDYEARIGVLQELQFIDDRSTVLLKGRVACEINSANELILTELILENVFAAFEAEEVVALLSAFIFQEKTDVEPLLTPRLEEGRTKLLEMEERVSIVSARHRAEVEGESGRDGQILRFGLVEVVYEWAKGMPFNQITDRTDVQEGTIVRAITRLDETCREVRDAARVIGDGQLYQKMEACQVSIRRDVIFCASLYM